MKGDGATISGIGMNAAYHEVAALCDSLVIVATHTISIMLSMSPFYAEKQASKTRVIINVVDQFYYSATHYAGVLLS